ncbi:mitochondrial inner membrane protein OXA1, putative [Plasmodium gallinaceum]|uniref:Mitochondrial inner membrane protein OXA1, putative n=1 Tax=Plasmodium gallinaceum TaxID=5849 RepID=A0A1J1GMM7_PLAGA|nr:mitochondrial inner membrane protein OXA1, putative [Plasmodium gallinaceum]CRG93509.1 mitochondrial inner membrane protein OXA1, putative [Plasmodium gallinaceum]
MIFTYLQNNLQNSQLKKNSLNLFINSICLKNKRYIIINRNYKNIICKNLKNDNYSSLMFFRNFSIFTNFINNKYPKQNESKIRENFTNYPEHMNKNENKYDEDKKEKSYEFLENENNLLVEKNKLDNNSLLNDKKKLEGTEEEYYNNDSFTHFIIEKCKNNARNDEDIYEDTWYVRLIYELLNCTKIILDCSWMTSIIATTIFMRIIILPLTISAERDRRKQKILNPLIKDLTNKLKINAQDGNIKKALEYKKRILNIRNTHGISLIPKSIILMTFFQTPLFCIFYFSMKKMSSYPDIFKDFTFESPLWLDSLSLPDPYYILPFLSSLLLLSNNELTSLIDKNINNNNQNKLYLEESEFQKNIRKATKIGMRLFYISSVFFFKSMPSGLFIYFITNTFFQLFITQICKVKFVERFLDLPPLHSKGFSFDNDDNHNNLKKNNIHMDDLLKNKTK